MNDQRRQIIVAEIQYWRINHLLPEAYCQFLLNLYTEGERQDHTGGSRSVLAGKADRHARDWEEALSDDGLPTGRTAVRSTSRSLRQLAAWMLGAGLISGAVLLVFHFNGFPALMQIAIITISSLLFYLLAGLSRRTVPLLSHVGLLLAAVTILAGGIHLLLSAAYGPAAVAALVAAVCLVWCIQGVWLGYPYWLSLGIAGLGLLYSMVTVSRMGAEYRWWEMELYWVPVAALLTGAGFLLRRRHPQLARVLAFSGLAFWFGAEIASLFVPSVDSAAVQMLVSSKVISAALFFFLTRRQWFDWLRL